jgi:hypothetical protein
MSTTAAEGFITAADLVVKQVHMQKINEFQLAVWVAPSPCQHAAAPINYAGYDI